MAKIRKVVIPAAGPRRALAFALPTVRSAAHAAALTGRADFISRVIREVGCG